MNFDECRKIAIEIFGAEPGIEGYDSEGTYGFGWDSNYGKELRAKLDAIDIDKDDISEKEFKNELFKKVVTEAGILDDKYVLLDYAAYVNKYSDLPIEQYSALLKESYPRYARAVDRNETPKPHRCDGGCVGTRRSGSDRRGGGGSSRG